MLKITEIKSYIVEAVSMFHSIFAGAEICPIIVCPSSRRQAVRDRVIRECGLDYKEDLYGTDAEVIAGPLGKQILLYQSMMKSKKQVYHALWHEFGHLLFGDEKRYGIDLQVDTPLRSGYAVFNEFVAEYIAYIVNEAEPFPNVRRPNTYLQMAFQEQGSITPYWLSRYYAIVLGDSTVSGEEIAAGKKYVSSTVWAYINQLLNELTMQVKKTDFWIADAAYIEGVGRIYDDMFHEVFMDSLTFLKWR